MNFNITTPFDSEIELLKAKLAELETQKHRVSTCANRIVEQVGECVIEMKSAGVNQDILTDWACVIYREITGDFIPQEKLNESQDQIDSLTDQIKLLESRHESAVVVDVDKLINERNEALDKFVKLTEASLRVSEELKGVRASLAIANKEAFDARKELANLTMQEISGDADNSIIEALKLWSIPDVELVAESAA